MHGRFKHSLVAASVCVALIAAAAPARADGNGGRRLKTPLGDVAFEVVGQVTNTSPTTSHQYGYLSLIKGLGAEQIFTTADPAAQNHTTALFTFFTDAVTERVITNGPHRIVNRVGTTTIYFDDTPDGDFSNRDTFRDGAPVLVLDYRQQVVLDLASNTFSVLNLNTITTSAPFVINGESLRLGNERGQFRVHYAGANNTAPRRTASSPGTRSPLSRPSDT